ncbi:unnamed protein product [Paramecium primaurelia]|uniref:RING-type domain-containing protein n=1 Tax=Paramecium primaurelia TaxID=5886 RepID=A0A8S1K6G3_PARPR|nr:unnamed protein product [Paramecium primaurelia]
MLGIINVDVDFMEDGELFELEESEYLITQNINNATFYLIVSTYDIPRYIFLEIQFSYPKDRDVNFLTTVGKNQITKLENTKIITTYADFNGFYLKKDYHNIVIPPNSFKSGDKFFLTNLIRNDRRSYQYNLKIKKLPYQPCPNNCSSGSGKCVNGICACNQNMIDLDCSKQAIALKFEEKIENVTIQGTQYLYFEQPTQLEKIQFEFGLQFNQQEEDNQVMLYYMFEDYKLGVPTQLYRNFTLKNDLMSTTPIIIDISSLNYNANLMRFDRLIFQLVTEKEVTCNFEIVSLSSDDSDNQVISIIIYITISIASFIFIMIITMIIVKCKNNRQHNSQVRPSQEIKLSLEFLEQYMKLVELKKGLNNLQCSICLSGNQDQELRLTLCKHAFHCYCLYNWLNKSDGRFLCPNCRQDIDLEKLKRSGKQNPNIEKYQQNYSQSEINLNNSQDY